MDQPGSGRPERRGRKPWPDWAARQYLSRAVDYQAGRGDLHEMAVALDSLARLETDAGHLRRARESYERSLTLRRELGILA